MLKPENIAPLSESKKVFLKESETYFINYNESLEGLSKEAISFKIFITTLQGNNYYAHFIDKLRLREVKHFTCDQTARKWESWELNPNMTPKPIHPTLQCNLSRCNLLTGIKFSNHSVV